MLFFLQAEIGETREMIEDFNQYKAFGVGNPLPKYLARWNHPVDSPKASVPKTSYPNKDPLNKYKKILALQNEGKW